MSDTDTELTDQECAETEAENECEDSSEDLSDEERRYLLAAKHALRAKELGLDFIYDLVIRDLKLEADKGKAMPDCLAEYAELAFPQTSELALPDIDVKIIPSRDAEMLGLKAARDRQFYQNQIKQYPLTKHLEDAVLQKTVPDRVMSHVRRLCSKAIRALRASAVAYVEALDNDDVSPEELDELERENYKAVEAIPYVLDLYDKVVGFRFLLHDDIFPVDPALADKANARIEEESKKHGWELPRDDNWRIVTQ